MGVVEYFGDFLSAGVAFGMGEGISVACKGRELPCCAEGSVGSQGEWML